MGKACELVLVKVLKFSPLAEIYTIEPGSLISFSSGHDFNTGTEHEPQGPTQVCGIHASFLRHMSHESD